MNPKPVWSDPPVLNIPLLERLRAAPGFVSLAELAQGATDPAADLDALEAFGFGIERDPPRGVAYRGPSPRLCPDQIEHELGTLRLGRRIAVWSRLGSTNDEAARGAATVANDGLVVLAEEQTRGRGRRGRTFRAPPRSCVLMSVLLFPPAELVPLGSDSIRGTVWLTVLGAVAAAGLVADWTGREARIKWPNDVRVDGRKIAGVLVERAIKPAADARAPETAVVLGVGLNVNPALDDFPPELRDAVTSLRVLSGRTFDRSEVVRDLIRRLDHWYDRGLREGPDSLAPAWRDFCEHLGRRVRITTPNGPQTGRLVDLDLQRGPTLETDGGERIGVPLDAVVAFEAVSS